MLHDKEIFSLKDDYYQKVKDIFIGKYGDDYTRDDSWRMYSPSIDITKNIVGEVIDDDFKLETISIDHNTMWITARFIRSNESVRIHNDGIYFDHRKYNEGPCVIRYGLDVSFRIKTNYGSMSLAELNYTYGLSLPFDYFSWTEDDYIKYRMSI